MTSVATDLKGEKMNYDFSDAFKALIAIGIAIGILGTLAVYGVIELYQHISISWK